jgi:hypothetical protein
MTNPNNLSSPGDEMIGCQDCDKQWPAPPPLPENVNQSEMLDAFYSAIPEEFGTCSERYGLASHGTVAASIPLCDNDLKWLRGIRAAIAAMQSARPQPDGDVVTRVAKALLAHEKLVGCSKGYHEEASDTFEDLTPSEQEEIRGYARAAIAVMQPNREVAAMLREARAYIEEKADDAYSDREDKLLDKIDAALQPKEPGQ